MGVISRREFLKTAARTGTGAVALFLAGNSSCREGKEETPGTWRLYMEFPAYGGQQMARRGAVDLPVNEPSDFLCELVRTAEAILGPQTEIAVLSNSGTSLEGLAGRLRLDGGGLDADRQRPRTRKGPGLLHSGD